MMFMALDVTSRAPSPVKIAYVTYEMEHAWTVDLESLATTVIYRVQSTVMTINATCRMEHASPVNPDGLEYTVKQVMLLSKTVYVIKIYITFF